MINETDAYNSQPTNASDNNHFLLKLKRKVLLSLLGLLINKWLLEKPLSGQEIMRQIKNTYGFSLSSGTVYPILFSLRDKDLVEVVAEGRQKKYGLTPKGKALQQTLASKYKGMEEYLKEDLTGNKHELLQLFVVGALDL